MILRCLISTTSVLAGVSGVIEKEEKEKMYL